MSNVFVGREAELTQIATVWQEVQQGQAWLITLEGESGIGKTALAAQAVGPGMAATVLRARADRSETDLQYGVIEQLLGGVDRRVRDRYPVLSGQMSMSSPFAVGAELLAVVGEQQAQGPMVVIIDDVQWADVGSAEALSFLFRRLSVDPVLVIAVVRGNRERLSELIRRMLLSVPQRLHLRLTGLRQDDLAPLAAAVGAPPLDAVAARRLFEKTEGHTLYVRTLLTDPDGLARLESGQMASRSLAGAIGDQLAVLSAETRAVLEMLAVVNGRMPLALLGDAAGTTSVSAAIEPAVAAGLVDWWPHEPTCPVMIHHPLQRDVIYAGMNALRRRELHSRAVALVDDKEAWTHRIASLDRPDEEVAAQLERVAAAEEVSGQLALAASHLIWASDISLNRVDRERRLLHAALHLTVIEEARALQLQGAAEAAAPSPLRSSVLGTMALTSGRVAEAEARLGEALAEVRQDPENRLLAARIATRLAGINVLLGEGEKVKSLARWALETGSLDPATESRTRTLVAVGASQADGTTRALAELAYLKADPARVDAIHADALSFRGVFHFLAGDLAPAVADLTASLMMVRKGATITLGLRAYSYLALAQYFSGAWDDVLLTAEQGLSAALIRPRVYELPLLRLAATCVPAGRGALGEADQQANLAEQAAESLDYGNERLYAGMARALVCQAKGDYGGVVAALSRWFNDPTLDDRSRMYEVIWLPLLAEGLIGCGRHEQAAAALRHLEETAGSVGYLQPGLACLNGWLEEKLGHPDAAEQIYRDGAEERGKTGSLGSPVYRARLLLAFGGLLRRTRRRRPAIECLREANALFARFGAAPLTAQTEAELAACGLRPGVVKQRRSALEMTNREREVAHLVDRGLTNAEIAAELFITPKAVEYHLANIYAKFGLKGRQQLRRQLDQARQPTPA